MRILQFIHRHENYTQWKWLKTTSEKSFFPLHFHLFIAFNIQWTLKHREYLSFTQSHTHNFLIWKWFIFQIYMYIKYLSQKHFSVHSFTWNPCTDWINAFDFWWKWFDFRFLFFFRNQINKCQKQKATGLHAMENWTLKTKETQTTTEKGSKNKRIIERFLQLCSKWRLSSFHRFSFIFCIENGKYLLKLHTMSTIVFYADADSSSLVLFSRCFLTNRRFIHFDISRFEIRINYKTNQITSLKAGCFFLSVVFVVKFLGTDSWHAEP